MKRHSRRHRNPQQDKTQDKPFFGHTKEAKGKSEAKSGFFQPKLKVGRPNDAYEQEADSVADAVTAKPTMESATPAVKGAGGDGVQRYMTNAKEDEMGTNTQRMEKDKAIQEKPEIQMQEEEEAQTKAEEEPQMQEEEEAQTKAEEEPQMQEEEEAQTKAEEEPQMQEEEEAQTKVEEEPQMQEEEEAQTKAEEEPQMQEEEEAQTKVEEEPQMQEEEEAQTKVEEEPQMQEEEEEAQTVQMKGKPGTSAKKAAVSKKLSTKKGGGRPLPKATRAKLEKLMGADFSEVRIHTDREATDLNKSLRAQAFAHGRDVFFNAGKYRPETTKGLHLLAHELTHVVQQGRAAKKKPVEKQ